MMVLLCTAVTAGLLDSINPSAKFPVSRIASLFTAVLK